MVIAGQKAHVDCALMCQQLQLIMAGCTGMSFPFRLFLEIVPRNMRKVFLGSVEYVRMLLLMCERERQKQKLSLNSLL